MTEKGINYIIKKTQKPEINNISDISKLKNCSIPLDHVNKYQTKDELFKKRKTNRLLRKHNWIKLNSSNQRKELIGLKTKEIEYSKLESIRKLWKDFIQNTSRNNDEASLIARSDFCGAVIKVTSANDPSYVGVKGTIIRDNKNSLLVVQDNNKIKTLLKKDTVAEVYTLDGVYEANFSAAMNTGPLRMTKKWKTCTAPLDIPF